MTGRQVVLATLAGLALGAAPFLRYAHFGAPEAHTDHEPRHGGQLGMVGDHHIEVVRDGAQIRVYVSDARRGFVPARRVTVRFGERAEQSLTRTGRDAWTGADEPSSPEVQTSVELSGGSTLETEFTFPTVGK